MDKMQNALKNQFCWC